MQRIRSSERLHPDSQSRPTSPQTLQSSPRSGHLSGDVPVVIDIAALRLQSEVPDAPLDSSQLRAASSEPQIYMPLRNALARPRNSQLDDKSRLFADERQSLAAPPSYVSGTATHDLEGASKHEKDSESALNDERNIESMRQYHREPNLLDHLCATSPQITDIAVTYAGAALTMMSLEGIAESTVAALQSPSAICPAATSNWVMSAAVPFLALPLAYFVKHRHEHRQLTPHIAAASMGTHTAAVAAIMMYSLWTHRSEISGGNSVSCGAIDAFRTIRGATLILLLASSAVLQVTVQHNLVSNYFSSLQDEALQRASNRGSLREISLRRIVVIDEKDSLSKPAES